jgi:hypothetical protein
MLTLHKTKPKRSIPPYVSLGCPMAKGVVSLCRGLCVPIDGKGTCGRLAPHALVGRTQRAILEYNARHC